MIFNELNKNFQLLMLKIKTRKSKSCNYKQDFLLCNEFFIGYLDQLFSGKNWYKIIFIRIQNFSSKILSLS